MKTKLTISEKRIIHKLSIGDSLTFWLGFTSSWTMKSETSFLVMNSRSCTNLVEKGMIELYSKEYPREEYRLTELAKKTIELQK